MNILLFMEPDTDKLRFGRGTSLTAYYNMVDLVFHIPQSKVKTGTQVFIVMRQATGARDVIEAVRTGSLKSTYNYYTYKIPATAAVKIQSGLTEIAIMLLDANDIVTMSGYSGINLDIDNYKFSHQIALLRNLNISVVEHYEKIVELLMKLSKKGENSYDSQND